MMWLGVYQSAICWLLPASLIWPCHSLTYPHSQMGGRPIARRMTIAMAAIANETRMAVRPGASLPIATVVLRDQ
jgi:hypothetical protein